MDFVPGGGDFGNFFFQHAPNMNFLKENAFFPARGAGISDFVLSPGAGISDQDRSRPRGFPGVPPGGMAGTRIERHIRRIVYQPIHPHNSLYKGFSKRTSVQASALREIAEPS